MTRNEPTRILYRYRNADTVLKKNELNNAEIFLAPFSWQNDPMEGNIQFFWNSEDVSAWEKLIKHYLTGFVALIRQCIDLPQVPPEEIYRNYLERTRFNLNAEPEPSIDALFEVLRTQPVIFVFFDTIKTRQVTMFRSTLENFLFIIGSLAVSEATPELAAAVMAPVERIESLFNPLMIDEARSFNQRIRDNGVTSFHLDGRTSRERTPFAFRFDDAGMAAMLGAREFGHNPMYMSVAHAADFTKNLANVFMSRYCIASFSEIWDDPAMWGYYANSHSGVVLQFELPVLSGVPHIPLMIDGKFEETPLHKVVYDSGMPEADFFGLYSPDQAPEHLPGFLCEIQEDVAIQYLPAVKLKQWSHEREYRLILDHCQDLPDGGLKCEYDYTCLTSIILGRYVRQDVKTDMVIAVRDIENRTGHRISVYQADYSHSYKSLEKYIMFIPPNSEPLSSAYLESLEKTCIVAADDELARLKRHDPDHDLNAVAREAAVMYFLMEEKNYGAACRYYEKLVWPNDDVQQWSKEELKSRAMCDCYYHTALMQAGEADGGTRASEILNIIKSRYGQSRDPEVQNLCRACVQNAVMDYVKKNRDCTNEEFEAAQEDIEHIIGNLGDCNEQRPGEILSIEECMDIAPRLLNMTATGTVEDDVVDKMTAIWELVLLQPMDADRFFRAIRAIHKANEVYSVLGDPKLLATAIDRYTESMKIARELSPTTASLDVCNSAQRGIYACRMIQGEEVSLDELRNLENECKKSNSAWGAEILRKVRLLLNL